MKEPLKIQDVFRKTREEVYDISGGKQFPAVYDQIIKGDFYFTLPTYTPVPDPKPIYQPVVKREKFYTPTFETTPSGANMQIEGYGSWYEGMKLKKGKYDIRVSKSGYETVIYTINLSSSGSFRFPLEAKGGGGDFSFTKIDKGSYIIPAMVKINRGSFTMGSNSGGSDEKPTHRVNISYGFYMGKYEVTFEEYDKFCEDTGAKKPKDRGWGRGKQPVIYVNWNDAKAYAKWLSQKTGKNYRLPTEAEWEYVARAGTTTKWSFGNSESDLKYYAWYDKNSYDKGSNHLDYGTHPVGQKNKNPWGLYDMYGNLYEWCEDWYKSDYNNAPTNGSENDNHSQKSSKVLRGGSWYNSSGFTRSAYRYFDDPSVRSYDIGFRLAGALH